MQKMNTLLCKTKDYLRRINHKQKSLLYFLGYKNPLNGSRCIIVLINVIKYIHILYLAYTFYFLM